MRATRSTLAGIFAVALLATACSSDGDSVESEPVTQREEDPIERESSEPEPDADAELVTSPHSPDALWDPFRVDPSYFDQFPQFEPRYTGNAPDDHTLIEVTSGTWKIPSEAPAGFVRFTASGSGLTHAMATQGESAVAIPIGFPYNYFGENLFEGDVELVYNVLGVGEADTDWGGIAEPATHWYMNSTFDSWSAEVVPVLEVPELLPAMRDGASGAAAAKMFRHDGSPLIVRAATDAKISGEIARTDGETATIVVRAPRDGEALFLVPAGAAWVNLKFEGDWEISMHSPLPSLTGALEEPQAGMPTLYGHDGSETTIENRYPDVEYIPVSVDGDRGDELTGDLIEIAEGVWWVFARHIE